MAAAGGALLTAIASAGAAACRSDGAHPPGVAAPVDPWIATPADVAVLLIHLDKPLGSDLKIVGLAVAARPDRTAWVVTLYSKVLRSQRPRPAVWIHAYPQASQEYFTLAATGAFPSADAGLILKDTFLLQQPGAFNLYAGVIGSDGGLGPAVGLGWIGAGDPDTAEYHRGYRFLQEADDSRAEAMLVQTQREYPNAKLP